MAQQFVLSTVFEESDWDPLFDVMYRAFQNSPEITVMYPGGLNPAYRAEYATNFKKFAIGDGTSDWKIAKITEQRSGEITSYIACSVFRGPLGIIGGNGNTSPPSTKLPMIKDSKDREFYEWYWSSLRTTMRTEVEEIQVPTVHIQSLCTDPVWQNHGAATKLMEWIIDFAAKAKIGRCSLLASTAALEAGFYEKFGFRIVYSKKMVDEDLFPGKEGQPIVVMVKDLKLW